MGLHSNDMKGSIEERNDRWRRKLWMKKLKSLMDTMYSNVYETMEISPHIQGRAMDITLEQHTDDIRRRWIAMVGYQPITAPQYINVNISVTPNGII